VIISHQKNFNYRKKNRIHWSRSLSHRIIASHTACETIIAKYLRCDCHPCLNKDNDGYKPWLSDAFNSLPAYFLYREAESYVSHHKTFTYFILSWNLSQLETAEILILGTLRMPKYTLLKFLGKTFSCSRVYSLKSWVLFTQLFEWVNTTQFFRNRYD